ncbi:hypothetical protein [Alcanivorax sediminis]|uniref:Uncharacterized protein n=1 Tax=Alcanivorax sediminis TaxID=2663008 RepID=A0A6N7LRC1_9GAMM|nr:hypothetical protein [Alcanivorax sediminis]MQX52927.1 hypothetical protein [Alcanivorax sediminis]
MRILFGILFLLLVLIVGGGYYVYSYHAGESVASVNINDTELAEIGSAVIHPKFGEGEVLDIRQQEFTTTIHIDFGSVGKKWLIADAANLHLRK